MHNKNSFTQRVMGCGINIKHLTAFGDPYFKSLQLYSNPHFRSILKHATLLSRMDKNNLLCIMVANDA